mmetsp:Transcript_71592/g.142054  ORF Transcript_71592/g.142054 Transcript_71592/m.142054 type:complete len:86 (-) Transcript_71592:100-357(-)
MSGLRGAEPVAAPDGSNESRQEALEILYEIATLLNTGLNKDTLAALVGLCELGVNPEALAEAVQDLRQEANRLREDAPGEPVVRR